MLPLKEYVYHPKILLSLILKECGFWIPDKHYLQLMYFLETENVLRLKHPKTFGEKIQWLKLYDRQPKYTTMVDKYAVKDYVANIIGKKYIIPTLGVWDKPEDIEFASLPNQFVLKTTHGGGGVGIIVCKNKSVFNVNDAIQGLKKAMKQDIFRWGREWAYKNVKPRIIAEKYLVEEDGELKDYKVFTFNGEPRIIELDYNRFKGHQRNLYDFSWNKIDASIEYQSDSNRFFEKPKVLEELFNISRQLSVGIPHVRIDYYIVDNHIYFGEFTFYHGSGYEKISPKEFDYQLGKWLQLPNSLGNQQ